MGTVAVFSDADRASPHVREADHAVRLGPAPARDSYLRQDLILQSALDHGATIIHPGYGFLSENADFAREVEAAGLAFAGPTADQIVQFGEKHTARALAEAAGVPLLAGTGLLATADEAVAAAESLGLPVMVKATGGGGGIGMQACFDAIEVRDAFLRVESLARKNFGSAGVFLERLVRPARHVEVQLFGDGAGQIAVIGDRDCSLQRRNQKVIEEAPAPALPDHVRTLLHTSARDLLDLGAVPQCSDGRVRLRPGPRGSRVPRGQHPAAGGASGHRGGVRGRSGRADAAPRAGSVQVDQSVFDRLWLPEGSAVEARVYAEDPGKNSLPSSGLVTFARFPGQGCGRRSRESGWTGTSRPGSRCRRSTTRCWPS